MKDCIQDGLYPFIRRDLDSERPGLQRGFGEPYASSVANVSPPLLHLVNQPDCGALDRQAAVRLVSFEVQKDSFAIINECKSGICQPLAQCKQRATF